jgi:hypothetical protein
LILAIRIKASEKMDTPTAEKKFELLSYSSTQPCEPTCSDAQYFYFVLSYVLSATNMDLTRALNSQYGTACSGFRPLCRPPLMSGNPTCDLLCIVRFSLWVYLCILLYLYRTLLSYAISFSSSKTESVLTMADISDALTAPSRLAAQTQISTRSTLEDSNQIPWPSDVEGDQRS